MPLFNGGYHVRHSILQDSSLLGRLGQHADWRADRILPLARRPTRRSGCHLECDSGWRACARSCAARIRQLATLAGNRWDNTWAMADRVAIRLWLRRSWPTPVLAFRFRRDHRAPCHLGALAGLEAE